MTEHLLEKLEEKMMLLIAEIEDARKEIKHLVQENAALKTEKEHHARKLSDLIALLEAVSHEPDTLPSQAMPNANMTTMKPMLMTKETVAG